MKGCRTQLEGQAHENLGSLGVHVKTEDRQDDFRGFYNSKRNPSALKSLPQRGRGFAAWALAPLD